jgi:hypothetical protein
MSMQTRYLLLGQPLLAPWFIATRCGRPWPMGATACEPPPGID